MEDAYYEFFDKTINVHNIWNCNYPIQRPSLEKYLKLYRTDNCSCKYLYLFTPNHDSIDLIELKHFIDFLHTIPTDENGRNILPVYINFEGAKFADKLIYILFETVVNYLIIEKGWLVSVEGEIGTENCSIGVVNSSLVEGNWHILEMDTKDFESNLVKWNKIRLDKYKHTRVETDFISHSRYFVNVSADEDNVTSDILSFLTNSTVLRQIDIGKIKLISTTINEIISNCTEHTKYPYIYDIDIKKVIHTQKSYFQGKHYISINVGIWDFSNLRLGDAIKEKIHIIKSDSSTKEQIDEQVGLKKRVFEKLLEVYNIHTDFFTDNYTLDDFFALSAFQPGVTGRFSPGRTGGAGLSHLLDFLKDYPDNYRCYCLTGDTIINLDKKFLNKDSENWYTFNDDKEYIFQNSKPCSECVYKSPLFYPGTAFFLHLELNDNF